MSELVPTCRPGISPGSASTPLRVFSLLTAVMTFVLVWVGGLVTSHGAGMSVPDWPNTYGYNMFFFPISKWIGGIFYEHTHRLIASGVGLLTSILALWLFGYKSRKFLRVVSAIFIATGIAAVIARPSRLSEDLLLVGIGLVGVVASFFWPRCQPSAKWLRTLGVIAFFAVVIQGVLGGLRVTEMKDQLGIFHATLAQMFFCLVSSIALFQTKFWQRLQPIRTTSAVRIFYIFTTMLILGQLILGATMRHQHAGLSIPDFPLAYGKLWPATNPDSIALYNETRLASDSYNYITAAQVILQMIHRIVAMTIVICVLACFICTLREFGWQNLLARWTCGWFVLICCQAFLGAATIWTGKSADIATAHVACGALSLLSGTLLTIVAFRMLAANANQTVRDVPIQNSFGISHSTT